MSNRSRKSKNLDTMLENISFPSNFNASIINDCVYTGINARFFNPSGYLNSIGRLETSIYDQTLINDISRPSSMSLSLINNHNSCDYYSVCSTAKACPPNSTYTKIAPENEVFVTPPERGNSVNSGFNPPMVSTPICFIRKQLNSTRKLIASRKVCISNEPNNIDSFNNGKHYLATKSFDKTAFITARDKLINVS